MPTVISADSMTSPIIPNATLNQPYLKVIYSLQKNSTHINCRWIPSHVCIHGNEEADKTVKSACLRNGRENGDSQC